MIKHFIVEGIVKLNLLIYCLSSLFKKKEEKSVSIAEE